MNNSADKSPMFPISERMVDPSLLDPALPGAIDPAYVVLPLDTARRYVWECGPHQPPVDVRNGEAGIEVPHQSAPGIIVRLRERVRLFRNPDARRRDEAYRRSTAVHLEEVLRLVLTSLEREIPDFGNVP